VGPLGLDGDRPNQRRRAASVFVQRWLVPAVDGRDRRDLRFVRSPLAVPAVSEDLYQAGKWMRANVGSSCADYLVGDPETAYWLHLAVLGNPRSSARTSELNQFDPRAAIAPWITSEGRPYAIADLRLLPDEVKSRIDIAAQFNSAAVIKRRDATMKGCD
jgi:hypothetical protein